MVQLSLLYMTAGKTIALTIQTFVSKVMSLLFNTLSRFVIASLPKTNILEPKKVKCNSISTYSSSIGHEVRGPDAMILVF